MHRTERGAGQRLLLIALAIVSFTAMTWGWQVLYTDPNVGLLGAVSVITIPATVGIVAAYYGLHG